MKRKVRYTIDDIVSHLEEKIASDSVNDEEYGLYIDFQELGAVAFKLEEHQDTVRRLLREMKEQWAW